jgi:hypothetical protein
MERALVTSLLAMTALLHNASVVTDPNTLTRFKAEVSWRKSKTETARITYDLSLKAQPRYNCHQ